MKLMSRSADACGYPAGVIFETTAEHGRALVSNGFATKVIKAPGAAMTGVVDRPKPVKAPSLPEWPMRLSPETYLQRHPDGKHAEVAQQYVDAGLGSVKAKE